MKLIGDTKKFAAACKYVTDHVCLLIENLSRKHLHKPKERFFDPESIVLEANKTKVFQ